MDLGLRDRKKVYLDRLMSVENDISAGAEVVSRYCICISPRSGSTLLCDILKSTGLAGAPDEYLNPLHIAAWMRQRVCNGSFVLENYLADIEHRRTTSNGFFGMKVHWRHPVKGLGTSLSDAALMPIMSRFGKLVLISRADKVAQAVSDLVARQTEAFKVQHEKWLPANIQVAFDEVQIARTLTELLSEERNWRCYLQRTFPDFMEVRYEDLLTDYDRTVGMILKYLGLDGQSIPPMPSGRMSGTFNSVLKAEWLRKVGL